MSYIAGVDIGNSTTEVCVGEVTENGNLTFLTSASLPYDRHERHGRKCLFRKKRPETGNEPDRA